MRFATMLALGLGFSLVASSASAEIYKYRKKNGTVVYTDNLADLPPKRRAHYNKLKKQREERRQRLAKSIGKEELKRQELERKKKELERAKKDSAESKRRMEEIKKQIKAFDEMQEAIEKKKRHWQERVRSVRKKLEQLLADFEKTQEERNAIAIQPSFARFPGQNQKLAKLEKKLAEMEARIDELIVELEETIPEEARKSGIPQRWLRDA